MLEISYIELHKEAVIHNLKNRKVKDAAILVENILHINQERKRTQLALDTASAQANQIGKEIQSLLITKDRSIIDPLKEKNKRLKEEIKTLEAQLRLNEQSLRNMLCELPNLTHVSVPIGENASDNVLFQVKTLAPKYSDPLPHWDLVKKYDIIDFDLGNKITGAGFPVYKGKGAKLQRALINFFLDEAEKAGYQEIQPPILVNRDSVYATGQLPDKEGQIYELANEPFYLIPTAEIPLTNLYRDQIVDLAHLPIRLVGYTPCFRREAGSWGSHVRGLNRLHEFDKVEIVEITLPKDSYQRLESMYQYVTGLVQQLTLPYRIAILCTGDIGFTSAFTYDIEVFSIGQNRWLEVSSISNFETYQANRLQLRYREQGQTRLLHTLNGSAIALPRIMAALLEYNFTGDRINIPPILQPYTGFDYID
jgi:seryl-tRNA synthetase